MSDNLGFGACGCGSSSAGFGSPAQVNSSTAKLLLKEDGTYGDAVKIDTTTGDYVLDANGNKVGWDSLDQMVYLALRTVRGSSAVLDMGIDEFPKVIADDTDTKIRNAVSAALSKLIARGLIALVDVIITRVKVSGLTIEVRWKDITTGKIQSSFV